MCRQAGEAAAVEHGVPEPLMRAIAMVETGRRVEGTVTAWPWSLNVEGAGQFLPNRAALEQAVSRLAQTRRTSFDVGCFQINYRWHGDAFSTAAAMVDPRQNARYAARFLASLASESGDWLTAAGHYHSRTPALAARYRARVRQALANLGSGPSSLAPPSSADARTRVAETPRASQLRPDRPTHPVRQRPRATRPGALTGEIDGAAGPLGAPLTRPRIGLVSPGAGAAQTALATEGGGAAGASTVPLMPAGRIPPANHAAAHAALNVPLSPGLWARERAGRRSAPE
ncbi:MAG: lytic transglycosylase domain-containing protein [Pseudomonadota bacterium]